MYKVEELLSIHIWVVASIGVDFETAENNLRAMLNHVDDILRIAAVLVPGIQFVRLSPGWQNEDKLKRVRVFHRIAKVTAIYYETLTTLPIPPIAPYLLADLGTADQSSAG
jgi:hypothetical protein